MSVENGGFETVRDLEGGCALLIEHLNKTGPSVWIGGTYDARECLISSIHEDGLDCEYYTFPEILADVGRAQASSAGHSVGVALLVFMGKLADAMDREGFTALSLTRALFALHDACPPIGLVMTRNDGQALLVSTPDYETRFGRHVRICIREELPTDPWDFS